MSRLARLSTIINRLLGYRAAPPPKQLQHIVWMWSWIGAFCGVSLIEAVFEHAHYFIERGGPSTVVIVGAIEAPLAQPRVLFGGHFLGDLVGIFITKLLHLLLTEERFEELVWLAGSLSCAMAVVVMQVTETPHPPAGTTALLAAVYPEICDMGWYYLLVVLLTSTLALIVALIFNKIQRRYPVFGFMPVVLAIRLYQPCT